jgi:hypothetical protein
MSTDSSNNSDNEDNEGDKEELELIVEEKRRRGLSRTREDVEAKRCAFHGGGSPTPTTTTTSTDAITSSSGSMMTKDATGRNQKRRLLGTFTVTSVNPSNRKKESKSKASNILAHRRGLAKNAPRTAISSSTGHHHGRGLGKNLPPATLRRSSGATDDNDMELDVDTDIEMPGIHTEGLMEATPVAPDDTRRISFAQEMDPDLVDAERTKALRIQRTELFCRLFLCTSLGLVGLVVALVLRYSLLGGQNNRNDNANMIAMTESPTASPTAFTMELKLRSSLPNFSLDAITQDAESPQAQAFQWLMNDPSVQLYPEWRLLQRFALASLYYATGTYIY